MLLKNLNLLVMAKEMVVLTIGYINKFLKLLLYFLLIIDCVEVEISPDNWIMSVDANNTDLAILSAYYHIDWKECRCLKGVKLEDVTPELEQKAFEEMK